MSNIIDARGLSCPQPVIMTLNEIKKTQKGDIIIMVDTDTAKENVSRASKTQGWTVADVQPEDDGYRITIRRES
ncbi:MAG: preprotein translocase subunit TatB [Peptococcaceae bacterium]|nr:preprotein translocase subunit TatB [Candidatus Syntrophopropionicum ammoniitolerans]